MRRIRIGHWTSPDFDLAGAHLVVQGLMVGWWRIFWGYTVLFSNEVRKQYSELHMTLNGDLGKWSLREVVT